MDRAIEFHAAGRSLDALVAERVLDGAEYEPETLTWRIGNLYGSLPAYSTDIAAAWEVVNKLRQDGLHLQIDSDTSHWTVPPLSFTGWVASFVRDGKHHMGIADTDYGDTIAVAICRAALKVCE